MGKTAIDKIINIKGDIRGESYIHVSAWINDNTRPEDSIAFAEIGYLGYFTNNKIIDLLGLINPVPFPHIVQNDFSWAFWYYKPDYYLYLSEFDWLFGEIISDPRFLNEYSEIQTLDGPHTSDFIIYKHFIE